MRLEVVLKSFHCLLLVCVVSIDTRYLIVDATAMWNWGQFSKNPMAEAKIARLNKKGFLIILSYFLTFLVSRSRVTYSAFTVIRSLGLR
jgi:hypothetical protein